MSKKTRVDLHKKFRQLRRKKKGRSGRVDVTYRADPLIVDLDAELASLTLADYLTAEARGQLSAISLTLDQQTIERRKRARNNPNPERYNSEFRPGTGTEFGIDSGMLMDALVARLELGRAVIKIPRARAKAARVFRHFLPLLDDKGGGAAATSKALADIADFSLETKSEKAMDKRQRHARKKALKGFRSLGSTIEAIQDEADD